jgi:hypothetical protein
MFNILNFKQDRFNLLELKFGICDLGFKTQGQNPGGTK